MAFVNRDRVEQDWTVAPAGEAPLSRKRYLVVAAVFVLSFITYIDRAAISTAKGPMAAELSLSDQAMGLVFSAFALGYALAQIPAGWFADRCGPRVALAVLVGLWSLLTALTGTVSGIASLLVIRLLFGMAEAGAFPGSARAFYNWLPAGERGLANGILFSGALLGGAIAFPICTWLLGPYGWRQAFYLLTIPGVAWAALWLIFFRDRVRQPVPCETPQAKPRMSIASVFRKPKMTLAMLQYFAGNFTFFLCMTWMFPYLSQRFGLSQTAAARYAMVPLLCGSVANWISGSFVDFLYRSGHRAWSRRMPGIVGFILAAGGISMVSVAEHPMAAMVGFAVATFGVEVTISPSWAYCIDIGGENSGSISGAMNMVGNIGAFASANAFPYLHKLTGNSAAYFSIAAVLNLAAVICWFQMRPSADVLRLGLPGESR
jgi:ACS family glucarate transporter-like MFS transporter